MKILIYGDSNVWGYQKIPREIRQKNKDPNIKFRRLAKKQRWAERFAEEILKKYPGAKIVIDGLNSRVAGSEDLDDGLNGRTHFPDVFAKDSDCDFVIIALGTNDLKPQYGLSAQEILQELLWYKDFISKRLPARALFILPPNFAPKEGGMQDSLRREVINRARDVLSECELLEQDNLDLSPDGVHLSPLGHRQLAISVTAKIEGLIDDQHNNA